MPYPTISKYCISIRHPKLAFRKKDPATKVEQDLDPILVAGKPVEKAPNSQGVKDLWTAAGGFACVFKYETFSPNKLWAVRCFLQSTSTVASHYNKISSRIKSIPCSFYFIDFTFLEEGIRVDGNLYPIVRMEWVEGKDLRSFIRDNLHNPSKLDSLAQSWIKLSKDLLDAGIAHGDLQHGNILVDDSHGINIKLIDYDSLYFSKDGLTIPDQIKGIPDYQHPLRKHLQNQCLEIDFFSQLVIYISLRALAEKSSLWNTYKLDNTERLLFSSADFENPDLVQIFADLSQLSSDVSRLADELKKICKLTDFSKIPSLDTVLTPPRTKWTPVNPPPPTTGSQRWIPVNPVSNPTPSPSPAPTTGSQRWIPANPVSNPTPSPSPTPATLIQASATSVLQKKTKVTIMVRAIAVVSTLAAAAFGAFCYYQEQEINKLKQQIENQKQSLDEQHYYSKTMQAQINRLTAERDRLSGENTQLTAERDKLQMRVDELTKPTYIKFCNQTDSNKTSKRIAASLVFWDGKGLRSKGWWIVDPSKCREVQVGFNYRGNVYIYGDFNRGESSWGSGDYSFCVDTINAFEIANSDKDSCSETNQKRVTMSEFYVSPGTNTWTFS